MKETYFIIRNHLLNGVFAYAIFGVFALTISPFITQFFDYGERHYFVGIFGFTMLFAEFFALYFKLKMVRLRSEEKRIVYKRETGKDILPSATPYIYFGFFMRMVFHVAVIMVSMTALGYIADERNMSPQGVIAIMCGFMLDMCGFIYIYFKTDFYTDPPQTRKEFNAEIKEGNDWYNSNKHLLDSKKHFRLELICDLVLQIYALMLFTSFWHYVNQVGIETLSRKLLHNRPALESGMSVVPMLIAVVMLGLMPMRIAYWIEDSMNAITIKEKSGMWLTFFIVAVFSCSPVILKFISMFILRIPETSLEETPWYLGHIMSVGLFLILLIIQILLFGKRDKLTTSNL